ncbi:hypothetical protein [Actinoplanes derwentensis]|nr:hypothetical protein [Actinoplanes derwentensis]
MRIEDTFTGPGGGVVVTGRVVGGPILSGDVLLLHGGGGQHAVRVLGLLRLCGRQDAEIAQPEENAAILLADVPSDLDVIGLMLHNVGIGEQ